MPSGKGIYPRLLLRQLTGLVSGSLLIWDVGPGHVVGFTGIRVTRPGWAKYPATLPEGWDRLEIDRVWVRGEAKRLVAVNGRPAQLLEAD